jgi:peroxin-12
VWRNLAVMVGVPYLKRKLDEAYDVHVAPSAAFIVASGPRYVDRDALPENPTARQRVLWWYKWFLRRVYPSVNAAYHFSILAFSLGYLFDGTKYSSPFLWLVGTRMRRLGEADYRAFALAAEKRIPGLDSGLGWRSIFDRRILYARLLSSLKILLPTSIFALKFLEWWHASDFSRQLSRKAAEGLELPPPVVSGMGYGRTQETENEKRDGQQELHTTDVKSHIPQHRDPPMSSTTCLPILTVPPPPTSDLCPICLHPISNPAACQTGYVFDYKCIFQWIEGTHERQTAWMKGEKMSEWEEEDDDDDNDDDDGDEIVAMKGDEEERKSPSNREGRWESGKGRCAITGRRVLGGTGGLRRVMV